MVINSLSYDVQAFELEMELAIKGDEKSNNVFIKLGMLGRCIHNLILGGMLTGKDAERILKLLGKDNIPGINSANLRKGVRHSHHKLGLGTNPANFPYMPVFWMMPIDKYQLQLKQLNEEVAATKNRLEREHAKKNDLANRFDYDFDGPDLPPGDQAIIRVDPVNILHKQLYELEILAKNAKHDYKVYLPTVKMVNETSALIFKYDDKLGKDVDNNKIIEQFDNIVEFVFMLGEEYPEVNIEQKFKEFMRDKL